MDINTHEKMYQRHNNRLLLNVLNCDNEEVMRDVNIPLNDWVTTYMELAEKRAFDPELYTEIHLPVMIKGEWMMVVSVPDKRTFKWV